MRAARPGSARPRRPGVVPPPAPPPQSVTSRSPGFPRVSSADAAAAPLSRSAVADSSAKVRKARPVWSALPTRGSAAKLLVSPTNEAMDDADLGRVVLDARLRNQSSTVLSGSGDEIRQVFPGDADDGSGSEGGLHGPGRSSGQKRPIASSRLQRSVHAWRHHRPHSAAASLDM